MWRTDQIHPAGKMNPYESPGNESQKISSSPTIAAGRNCSSCGSSNTTRDRFARTRPSIIAFLLFGWVFLLIKGAFAMRADLCRDCGELNRYKSIGSWIAMAVLVLLVLLVIVGMVVEKHP
jgi:hypothetical protein